MRRSLVAPANGLSRTLVPGSQSSISSIRLRSRAATVLLACVVTASSANAQEKKVDTSLLTVTGTVLLPDGSPAVGATIQTTSRSDEPTATARTDRSGSFQLQSLFGNGATMQASSVDGNHQTTMMVSAGSTRKKFASPITLTLAPAVTHEVTVRSEGRPVAAAHVVAKGSSFKILGETNNEGRVELRLPAGVLLEEVAAWHPELGVAGTQDRNGRSPQGETSLSLLAPAPYSIRAIDSEGKPVAGLELGTHVRTDDSDWILSREIAAAHFKTDADGTARLAWIPRDKLKYLDVDVIGADWKLEDVDGKSIGKRLTTVTVRRKSRQKPVTGRLVMPPGVSAEGILITGYGFGPQSSGDIPFARAKQDGVFELQVPADHAYLLGISDLEWASELWSGLILESETAKPAEIKMSAYPATPVSIRVTRGPSHVPVAGAWVHVSRQGNVEWVDRTGEKRNGSAGVHSWLRTDAAGSAHAGLGVGPQKIRLNSGQWNEEQTIKINSYDRVAVEFHRTWLGSRRITGQLLIDGAPYKTSRSLVTRAWIPRSGNERIEPVVRPDGTFDVDFDETNALLLFIDRDRERSAFVRIGPTDSTLTLPLQQMATYGGVLVGKKNQPLPDRTLRLSILDMAFDVVPHQQTDAAGRFKFVGVPVDIPLKLNLGPRSDGPQDFILDSYRLFKTAEVRENDNVRLDGSGSVDQGRQPPIALADSVTRLCRDAQLNGMRGLVILEGDDTPHVARIAGHVLDYVKVPEVLAYVPLRVDSAKLESEAGKIAEYGWPTPAAGETVLVALNGDLKMIGNLRIKVEMVADAGALAAKFLASHRLPRRDGALLLAEAQQEAAASGRRLWLVEGGPRCGPCYRLARWMDDHHAAMEKDYVIVKLMGGLDEHVDDVFNKFSRKELTGIPWYAITEPDGKVLATCEGPFGNIGIPDSVEGLRHLRHMLDTTSQRLTPAEKDAMIKSLSPEQ